MLVMNFSEPVKRQVWTEHQLYSNATLSCKYLEKQNKEAQFEFEFAIKGTRTLFWVTESEKALSLLEPYVIALYNSFIQQYAAQEGIPMPAALKVNERITYDWAVAVLKDCATQQVTATTKVVTSGNGTNKVLVYCYNDGIGFMHDNNEINARIERAKSRAGSAGSNSGKRTAADSAGSSDAPPPF